MTMAKRKQPEGKPGVIWTRTNNLGVEALVSLREGGKYVKQTRFPGFTGWHSEFYDCPYKAVGDAAFFLGFGEGVENGRAQERVRSNPHASP